MAATLVINVSRPTIRIEVGAVPVTTGGSELVVGVDVQAYDAGLTSFALLPTVADRIPYSTGADVWAETALSAYSRTLLDDASAAAWRTTLGLVIGTDVQAQGGDLTALEALSSTGVPDRTSFETWTLRETGATGILLLATTTPGAARTILQLGIGSQVQQWDADLDALAALTTTGIARRTSANTWTVGTTVSVAEGGTGATTEAGARTALGLAIGTDVQAYDAGLASHAALPTAADRYAYSTAANVWAEGTITSFARSLLDDADASAMRTTLGVAIGGGVQAYSALLTAIAALTPVDGSFLIGTAAGSWDAVEAVGQFGLGTDGTKTVVGTETLLAPGRYTNLTVPNGTTLIADGMWIDVNGVAAIDGVIHDDGNPGVGATAGVALGTQGIRFTGVGPGTGRTTTGAGASTAAHGTVWANGYNPVGGSGGAVTGGAAGAGTAGATVGTNTSIKSRLAILDRRHWIINNATARPERGGGGGGAGGANVGTGTATSGGGGSGGGRVSLIARVLKGAGVIRAHGGAGGNAATTGDGSAGGGGGGTGGQAEVVAGYAGAWTGTITATGGAGGSSINQTVAATAGGTGYTAFYVEHQ